jgi:hypothetical protein
MSRTKLLLFAAAPVLVLAACSSPAPATSPPSAGAAAATSAAATTPAATVPAATTSAAAAGALSGTWSGRYSGAFQGTFTLVWRQSSSRLSGTIKLSAPANTVSIHGTVSGNTIRFGTVGSAAITYSGTVSGNSMSGTYKVSTGSSTVGGPWSASKSS